MASGAPLIPRMGTPDRLHRAARRVRPTVGEICRKVEISEANALQLAQEEAWWPDAVRSGANQRWAPCGKAIMCIARMDHPLLAGASVLRRAPIDPF
jgi:hypothetical protein